MAAGRKPKPSALKVLQGNPGRRKLNTSVKPSVEKLTPPFYLRDDGLTEWNRLEPELRRLGVLTTVDRGILEAYCGAYGDMTAAERLLAKLDDEERFVSTGANGQFIRHPLARARDDSRQAMARYAAELGITPSARSRVSPVAPDDGARNPFELIAGGKKGKP